MVLSIATRGKLALVFWILFACCRPVAAQPSVEVYGTINLGFVHESGNAAGSVNKPVSVAPILVGDPFAGGLACTVTNIFSTAGLASYIDHRDRTPLKQDASQFAMGCTYALSKRNDLYSSIGDIRNRNGAAFTVGNAGDVTDGAAHRAFDFGAGPLF
jgi:predicted porin